MKKPIGLVFLILLSCHVKHTRHPFIVHSPASDGHYALTNSASPILKEIIDYKSRLDSTLYSVSGDACRELMRTSKPNLSDYFTKSKHLRLGMSYTLDFIYECDDEARPFIYFRHKDSAGLKGLEDFRKEYPLPSNPCPDLKMDTIDAKKINQVDSCIEMIAGLTRNYNQNIKKDCFRIIACDKSPEGYFELVAYKFYYQMFGLRWHAKYLGRDLITDNAVLSQVLKTRIGLLDSAAADSLFSIFSKFDLTPSVDIAGDSVIVQYCHFTPYGGIIKSKECLKRGIPHLTLWRQDSTIAEYRSGFMY
jgi:hypothetical protein